MKKISVFFVTAILMIAFTACNGAKKSEAPAEQPATTDSVTNVAPAVAQDSVAATVPAAPAVSPADMLKNFQAFAKTYGDAFNNIVKDPQKFTDLTGQYKQKVDEMEQIKSQLNPAQLQAYQKALNIIIKVNSGGK